MEQNEYRNVSDVLLQKNKENIEYQDEGTKLYKKRWIILTIFTLYATINAAEWIEYSIIANIAMKYYNVSALAVDWTSMIYMALYMPFVIPTAYIVDTWGIRVAALLGGLGTALGSIVKLFSVSPNLFWVAFVGQVILSISEVPILCLPPKIAAVWFGSNEVSTACSIGIMGMQLGMALGFLLPPIFVKNHDVIDDIGKDLYVMNWMYAGIMIPLAILIIFFFPAQPKLPPSQTQLKERNNKSTDNFNFLSSLGYLLTIKAFLLHLVGFGINTGIFCAIGTMLNQFVLNYFPNSEEDAGRMGLVMVFTGMVGSVFFGRILDKTRKFKEVAFGLYMMSSISVLLFMYALESESKLLVYLSISLVGLCTNAYIPVGFELSVELTYPISESTASGILMGVSQSLGVGFTLMLGKLFAVWGTYWALCSQVILLAFGTIITSIIPNKMKRQAAFKKEEKHDVLLNSVNKQ